MFYSIKVILTLWKGCSCREDQRTLISAFELIHKEHPNWSVKIIGEGALRKELLDQITNSNLIQKVTLHPNSKNLETEYQNAKIFVLPSIYESFGLVLLEAMSHQLPLIAFNDCEGANQLVKDNENGILIKSSGKRQRDLAGAISTLIKDKNMRQKFGKNGKKYFNNFINDINPVVEWEQLLMEVVRNEK